MPGTNHFAAPLETLLHSTLVIDHDEALRRKLQQALERLGHQVTAVATGEAAIAEALRLRFSCCLLEITAADGADLKLIPALLEREPHLAIIIQSEINDAELSAHAMALGATAWLRKPVATEALVRTIRQNAWRGWNMRWCSAVPTCIASGATWSSYQWRRSKR